MNTSKSCLLWFLGIGFGLALAAPVPAEETSRYKWDDVPRVVTIGDVHGSYDKLLKLLQGTGLVDDALVWSGGSDHLVFVGDLIDRGPDDRQVLDLVRRLQTEAETAGGRVHVLLGNHEVMNMSGDLRYVSDKGFRDFLPEEDKKLRNRAMMRFRNTVGPGVPLTQIKPAFEKRFPPGYSGRITSFWKGGEYGDWLLEQPAAIMVNGVVFLHGGLTEEVASLGLDGINEQVHEDIERFREDAAELVELTGVPPSYADAMRVAHQLGEATDSSKRTSVARSVLALSESLPYVHSGPLWYRGVSTEGERLERTSVDQALADLGAKTMVVAHTPTASGLINSRFSGKVYRVDVGMAYGREPQALVFEGKDVWVYDPRSAGRGSPFEEPPQGEGVAHFAEQLPEAQLLDFLRTAKITGCQYEQRGLRYAEICDLEDRDLHLRAVFQTVDEKPEEVAEDPKSVPRTFRNEIAAFKVDRLLRIGLVPPTVERTHNGMTGSLQIWLESAVDQRLIETYNLTNLFTEEILDEIIAADAFMAFLDVWAPHESVGVMFLPHEKKVQVADSTKAFSTNRQLNPDLMTPPCGPIDPERELFLRQISPEDVAGAAGQYLSSEQIDALLARRDLVLDACQGTE
jgi:hypothetical protein